MILSLSDVLVLVTLGVLFTLSVKGGKGYHYTLL